MVGRFVRVRTLGSGAMGEVCLAYDGDLDRHVAIKQIRGRVASRRELISGLVREAKTMARPELRHPNVVGIYDVVVDGEGLPCIVMEHVVGQTLSQWRAAEERDLSAILTRLCAAGRGLAAAHAAGVVHRDFKPSNVMVSDDGEVKVTDFGVAGSLEQVEEHCALTRTDELAAEGDDATGPDERGGWGTPRYMSPEQAYGDSVDARSDQYSFCVTAYELVTGRALFDATTRRDQRLRPSEGFFADWNGPRWLANVLRRGLAPLPEDRFRDMDALVAALEAGMSIAPRRAAWLRGIGLMCVGLVVSWAVIGPPSERCSGGRTRWEQVWSAPTRARVEAAIRSADPRTGSEIADEVVLALDDYGASWTTTHADLCHAASLSQTAVRLDRQIACLERRRAAVRGLLSALEAIDAGSVSRAMEGIANLPAIAACRDPDALADDETRPADPTTRAEVETLRESLAMWKMVATGGRLDTARSGIAALLPRAETTEFGSVIAEFHLALAEVDQSRREFSSADEHLRAAVVHAQSGGDRKSLAEALNGRLFIATVHSGDRRAGAELLRSARAAVQATGDRGDLLAAFKHQASIDRFLRGDEAGGFRLIHEAVALSRAFHGPEHYRTLMLAHDVAVAALNLGELATAEREFEVVLTGLRKVVGDHHPSVALAESNSISVAVDRGNWTRAKTLADARLRRCLDRRGGPCWTQRVQVFHIALSMGEIELARKLVGEIDAMQRDRALRGDPSLPWATTMAALVELAVGKVDDAHALAREGSKRLQDETEVAPVAEATAQFVLAKAEIAAGEYRFAEQRLARFEVLMPGSMVIRHSRSSVGLIRAELALATGEFAQAETLAKSVIEDDLAMFVQEARILLARIDHARGRFVRADDRLDRVQAQFVAWFGLQNPRVKAVIELRRELAEARAKIAESAGAKSRERARGTARG